MPPVLARRRRRANDPMARIETSNGHHGVAEPLFAEVARMMRTTAQGAGIDAPTAKDRAKPRPRAASPRLVTRTFADIEPERLRWLMRSRIAFGKLSVLDGLPDEGKSTLQLTFAALVSRGAAMPDGSPGLGRPADVLILAAAEDGAADTIRPRLEAAGADLSRVHLAEYVLEGGDDKRMLQFPRDIPLVKDLIDAYGVRLVLVDALMATVSESANSNNDPSMRQMMHPLADLASETGAAFLLNRHFTKSGGRSAINRGGGSVAIIGVARTGLAVMRDPQDETGERRLLVVTKCNIGKDEDKATLVFRIVSAEIPNPKGGVIETSRIEWLGTDSRNADDVLQAADADGRERRAIDDAEEIIRGVLGDGEWHDSKEPKEAARREGISDSTLRDAAQNLKAARALEVSREGSGAAHRSMWRLVDSDASESGGHSDRNLDALSECRSVEVEGHADLRILETLHEEPGLSVHVAAGEE